MIGNIIYNLKFKNDLLDSNKLINVSTSLENVDLNLPTLIIGWKFVKKLLPNQKLSILDKKINDNLFWTFNRNEKRVVFEKDLNLFIVNLFSSIKKNLPYHFIDILKISENKYKKVIDFLNSNIRKHIYICNNSFIYIYTNHYVIGLDLDDFEYIGKRIELFKIINSNQHNKIFKDEYFINMGIRKLFINNKIIIPYLHYLNME